MSEDQIRVKSYNPLIDADGSGRILPESNTDQITGPGARLTSKIVSAHQSEISRLTKALEVAEGALGFYTTLFKFNEDLGGGSFQCKTGLLDDNGNIARKALEAIQKIKEGK